MRADADDDAASSRRRGGRPATSLRWPGRCRRASRCGGRSALTLSSRAAMRQRHAHVRPSRRRRRRTGRLAVAVRDHAVGVDQRDGRLVGLGCSGFLHQRLAGARTGWRNRAPRAAARRSRGRGRSSPPELLGDQVAQAVLVDQVIDEPAAPWRSGRSGSSSSIDLLDVSLRQLAAAAMPSTIWS